VSLGLLIGNVAKTTETASVIGNTVGFPMMMLTGTFFPVSLLPSYLQEFIRILPLYYFVQGLGDIMVTGKAIEGLLYLLVLLVMSIVFFWMAIYTFKWRDSSSVSKIARPLQKIQI
jgi:ABC-2 type transport system permease protein